MAITPRDCAICNNFTTIVLECGEMPLANGYAVPDMRVPLNVWHCAACDLYQLGDLVAPDTLFTDYAYRTNQTAQRLVWRELGDAIYRRRLAQNITLPNLIVDVGGNDGALLGQLKSHARRLLNIDPYAPEQVGEAIVLREPWNTATAISVAAEHGLANFITATNVFAHIPDAHASANAIATLLDVDGWAVIQSPWHRDLWLYNEFDTIYHEHVYYWGVRAMRALFQRHHMDVHDVEYLPNVHGGSLRYWIRHGNDGITDAVTRFADMEESVVPLALQSSYDAWAHGHHREWEKNRQHALALGAPAKAIMYWAMTNTAQYVSRVFDDTPAKQGKRVPGTSLTVEPFSEFPHQGITDPVIAMAWNHKAALTKRVRELGYLGPVL